jgi:4-diphosphocytidyl-2-C-methyl-D-erythritol kinase
VTPFREFAPAKVNLTLHVTGQRDDGYHLLDSLVVFLDLGDWLQMTPDVGAPLTITGPMAQGVPNGPENLISRAAALQGNGAGFAIELEKNLPHAAGLGGGSADAAAALRALAYLTNTPVIATAEVLRLGADVPVCLRGKPTRMSGIGDVLADVPSLPQMWCVLVNPGIEVPTGSVFNGLTSRINAAMQPLDWQGFNGFIDWLSRQRNDLEPPALALAPVIATTLNALRATPECALARMSGSGATCFGIFADNDHARRAAASLQTAHSDWWVAAARVLI